MASDEVTHFIDSDGSFLHGQELADAIKMHTVLRFNTAREYRIDWRPNLAGADLSFSQQTTQSAGGLQNKMLRDPSEWTPPTAEDLWKGDARYANFSSCDLTGTNLSDINLSNANFRESTLQNANLGRAQLRRAEFQEANCRDANLNGADLFEADLTEVNLRQADLRGANLYGATVEAHVLSRSVLDPTTILPDGEFYGSDESKWTDAINEARDIPTEDLTGIKEAVAEATAKPEPAAEEEQPAPSSFFSRLWNNIKALFER